MTAICAPLMSTLPNRRGVEWKNLPITWEMALVCGGCIFLADANRLNCNCLATTAPRDWPSPHNGCFFRRWRSSPNRRDGRSAFFVDDAIDGARVSKNRLIEITLRYNQNTLEQTVLAAIAWWLAFAASWAYPAVFAFHPSPAVLGRLSDCACGPRLRPGTKRLSYVRCAHLARVANVRLRSNSGHFPNPPRPPASSSLLEVGDIVKRLGAALAGGYCATVRKVRAWRSSSSE